MKPKGLIIVLLCCVIVTNSITYAQDTDDEPANYDQVDIATEDDIPVYDDVDTISDDLGSGEDETVLTEPIEETITEAEIIKENVEVVEALDDEHILPNETKSRASSGRSGNYFQYDDYFGNIEIDQGDQNYNYGK